MQTVNDYNFSGETVLMRVDFNVPLDASMQITDDSRIKAALPSIRKVLSDGGRLVLMSHLGRPKQGPEDKFSLRYLVSTIAELTGAVVHFASDCVSEEAITKASSLQPGEILLLENLRFYSQEKKGDKEFAGRLAALGTFYVNDAFGTAHRAHASTAVIADYFMDKKCFGLLMAKEIENARKVIQGAEKPFTAIVGGAKVSDKLLIIENLMNIADNIIIGGGMAYTFAKAMGGNIGNSLCELDKVSLCKDLIVMAKEKGVRLVLPSDSLAANKFAPDAETVLASNMDIPDRYMGLDIGTESIALFCDLIEKSKTIIWNGPMGVFEFELFKLGTLKVAEAVANATSNGAFSLIGGGDSAAAVYKFGFSDRVSYVSTGGGALLEFFEGKVLPGIAAIEQSNAKAE